MICDDDLKAKTRDAFPNGNYFVSSKVIVKSITLIKQKPVELLLAFVL